MSIDKTVLITDQKALFGLDSQALQELAQASKIASKTLADIQRGKQSVPLSKAESFVKSVLAWRRKALMPMPGFEDSDGFALVWSNGTLQIAPANKP